MGWMFYGCSSLTYINLSNFNTIKVTNMGWMFYGCSSLKKENVVTKDKRVLNQYNLDNK
jgi:surface protein